MRAVRTLDTVAAENRATCERGMRTGRGRCRDVDDTMRGRTRGRALVRGRTRGRALVRGRTRGRAGTGVGCAHCTGRARGIGAPKAASSWCGDVILLVAVEWELIEMDDGLYKKNDFSEFKTGKSNHDNWRYLFICV